jgi:LacI family gluconate utilization system Gnt-I transcriptional repressor
MKPVSFVEKCIIGNRLTSIPMSKNSSEAPRKRNARPKLLTYTNRDIARMARVSVVTVSRYFNSPSQVSDELRARVSKVIQETGYVPSQVAKRLASSAGGVVGTIMQNISSPTFARVVQGFNDVFEKKGLQLLLANSDYQQEAEARAIRTFLGWHPSALILTRGDHSPDVEAQLRALNIPVVEAWDVVDGRPFHQVGFRHQDVGVMQALHFLERGVQRVRFALTASRQDIRAARRAEGYAQTMLNAGVAADVVRAQFDDEFQAGEAIIAAYAQEPSDKRPRAIAFASDNMAIAALLRAPAYGIRVPQDCAMIGFGDAAVSAYLAPGLSTVRPQPYEIGKETALTIVRMLNTAPEEVAEAEQHVVPCTLVARDSSALDV